MGYRQEYLCNKCGLKSMNEGGFGALFAGQTCTGYCSKCEELLDVLIPIAEQDNLNKKGNPKFLTPNQRVAFTCDAHNQPLSFWRKGMPCPRCGGKLNATALSICAD